jgi:signal transduction histidine kinase
MAETTSSQAPLILYIDDDPVNRTLVKRLLTSVQMTVIEAESGLAGLRIAQRTNPDLILMDIYLPDLDGHETTTRMRSMTDLQDTPIVALTADVSHGAREMALAAGCDGYIAKPIDVDRFPFQIMAYLDGQRDAMEMAERQHYLGEYSRRLVERLEGKILELEEANRRLQKTDKLKSDFVTVAAHELQTPLTLVYGYTRLLQNEVQKEPVGPELFSSRVGTLANQIAQSVYRLGEVVHNILNISLIEANEMNLTFSSVNINDVIQAVLKQLDLEKDQRTLTFAFEDLNRLPPITGDEKRIQQVFWNLLSNAIKFTPDHGTILIKGWIDSQVSDNSQNPSQESLIIMIKDNGIGIDELEQKSIFGQFYRIADIAYHGSSKTAFKGGGMGLGLPIARGIVEAHGGQIWVESVGCDQPENPGSAFFVQLPVTGPDSVER